MLKLKEAIENQGFGIGNEIVKVDMFLNHRIDTELLNEIGKEFKRRFKDQKVDTILTVESSGIAMAVTTAQAFGNIPIVFAKKHSMDESAKLKEENKNYMAPVFSFTHKKSNIVTVSKQYLEKGSNVLIIDDFLANGEATEGMINILKQADCSVSGIGICIEKGFQPGGQHLRNLGYQVESLAIIKSIENGKLCFL